MKALSMVLPLLVSHAVFAHGGDDHGAPPAAATLAIAPRATAATEEFELVAIKEDKQLVLYLDRAATNEPVVGATVDVDGGGMAGRAIESAPGVYAIDASTLAPARHALTISVETGDSADLLAATLDVSAPRVDVEPAHGWREWQGWQGWLGAGLLGLAAGAWWMVGRRQQSKGLE